MRNLKPSKLTGQYIKTTDNLQQTLFCFFPPKGPFWLLIKGPLLIQSTALTKPPH